MLSASRSPLHECKSEVEPLPKVQQYFLRKKALTDTGEDSLFFNRRKRPKVDTLFSSFFFRRVRATSMTQRRVEKTRVHFLTFSPVSIKWLSKNIGINTWWNSIYFIIFAIYLYERAYWTTRFCLIALNDWQLKMKLAGVLTLAVCIE